jgi:hypothetical protein
LQKRWKEQQQQQQQLHRTAHAASHASTGAANTKAQGVGSSTALSGAALNVSSPGPTTTLMMMNNMSSNLSSEPRKRGHRKAPSFGRGELIAPDNAVGSGSMTSTQAGDDIILEVEQEVVEVIMASRPMGDSADTTTTTTNNDGGTGESAASTIRQGHGRSHRGNLARELAQVFHALGRNGDHRDDFAPSPSDLLTGRSGTVYVNRHIAVPIEPLSTFRAFGGGGGGPASNARSIDYGMDGMVMPLLRPYHTILFPLASPSQLLEALQMSSGSGDFRRLQQLLLVAAPQKDLREMSVDANLPLPKTIELASYLVSQGACAASPVLSRRTTRLVCCGVDRVRDAALPFSQAFGPAVNLFLLVSFLTRSGRVLDEAMREIGTPTSGEARHVALLREGLESSLDAQFHVYARRHPGRPRVDVDRADAAPGGAFLASTTNPSAPPPPGTFTRGSSIGPRQPQSPTTNHVYMDPLGVAVQESEHAAAADTVDEHSPQQLEDMLFQMAAWLRSRRVLNHLVEFLVACLPLMGGRGTGRGDSGGGDDDAAQHTRQIAARGSGSNDSSPGGEASSEKKVDGSNPRRGTVRRGNRDMAAAAADDDDAMFRELFESGCLEGRSSLSYCCYRLGLESASRLRAFALRHPLIRIVLREPAEQDDW